MKMVTFPNVFSITSMRLKLECVHSIIMVIICTGTTCRVYNLCSSENVAINLMNFECVKWSNSKKEIKKYHS